MKQVDIKGFEDYQITDDGRVWNKKSNKWLKVSIDPHKGGYYIVSLYKDGKQRLTTIHRLIAETFIPNPEKKPCVDHINTIRTDNRIENLRWVSYKENSNNDLTKQHLSNGHKKESNGMFEKHHSEETKKKISEAKKGIKLSEKHKEKLFKKVCQYTLDNEFIREFQSLIEIKSKYGFDTSSIIRCCRNKQKTAYGYIWRYKNDQPN